METEKIIGGVIFLLMLIALILGLAYLGERHQKEQKTQNETMQNLIIENEKMKILLEE